MACGAAARTDKSAVLVLKPIEGCFRLVVGQFPLAPLDKLELDGIVGRRGNCDEAVISTRLALYGDEASMRWSWPFSVFSSLMFRFAVLPHSSRRASESYRAVDLLGLQYLAQTIRRQKHDYPKKKKPESR